MNGIPMAWMSSVAYSHMSCCRLQESEPMSLVVLDKQTIGTRMPSVYNLDNNWSESTRIPFAAGRDDFGCCLLCCIGIPYMYWEDTDG